MRASTVFCLGVLLSLTVGSYAQPANLGHVDFPTSGKGEAQEHFIRGVLLLHNFEYDDAREEFQAASKLQADFAMAYWGEALTQTHQVWVEQDASAGRAALEKLGPTRQARLAKAPTQREKDYLSAVSCCMVTATRSRGIRRTRMRWAGLPQSIPMISRPRRSTRLRSSAHARGSGATTFTCARPR